MGNCMFVKGQCQEETQLGNLQSHRTMIKFRLSTQLVVFAWFTIVPSSRHFRSHVASTNGLAASIVACAWATASSRLCS